VKAHARRAEAWPAVMLLVGTAFGAAQLLRGAHYVSPTPGSGWLCWTGGLLAAGPAPRVGGPLPSEPAALD
jgi:membrane-associated PAP2 superfamily phosphatase